MEKILFALNAIKLTQQTHTQCFSELIKKVDDAPLHSTDIPDLPFSTVEDLLRYDEELGAKSEARVAMVILIYGSLSPKFTFHSFRDALFLSDSYMFTCLHLLFSVAVADEMQFYVPVSMPCSI